VSDFERGAYEAMAELDESERTPQERLWVMLDTAWEEPNDWFHTLKLNGAIVSERKGRAS
jgi:hypothetical protein